jgi:acetate kinase
MKNLLIINTGSTSIKFSLFNGKERVCNGECQRIGMREGLFSFNGIEEEREIASFESAIKMILGKLKESNLEFEIIAHRVVHGGELTKTCLYDEKVGKIIESYSKFAPVHNPYELKVIKICEKSGRKQYVSFDTCFFSGLPEKARRYAIPKNIFEKYKIRRYGFHGQSHKSCVKNLKGRTVVCHLGSGCSISASFNGKPIDCSMGFTPMEGVMMGTRAGDIDSGIVLFLKKEGYDMNKILNFESGLKAFSSDPDMRFITKNLDKKEVKLGFEMFIYKIQKYIGAYAAALSGLDNLAFTGAIGENSWLARKEICKNLGFLGLEIDEEKNKNNKELISSDKSKIKVYVKKTDEEKEIANEVYRLIG